MPISEEDLEHVQRHTVSVWDEMRCKRIFLTGAGGFLGRWLVESLLYANRALHLGASIFALTRSAVRFRDISPHSASDPALHIVEGDIRNFLPPVGRFDYLIHAAANTSLLVPDTVAAIDTEVAGFQNVFQFAVRSEVSRLLFVSSGAVYGPQNSSEAISECTPSQLDPARAESRYGELKRFGEFYGMSHARQFEMGVIIARCFSFFGPYQNLDSHFAIANFLREAIAGRDIVIQGDGLDRRSYLYAADIAVWLWNLLIFGRSCAPYNVGSDIPLSLFELANVIARVAGNESKVNVLGGERRGLADSTFLPNIERAKRELGLRQLVPLEDGIRKCLRWYRL